VNLPKGNAEAAVELIAQGYPWSRWKAASRRGRRTATRSPRHSRWPPGDGFLLTSRYASCDTGGMTCRLFPCAWLIACFSASAGEEPIAPKEISPVYAVQVMKEIFAGVCGRRDFRCAFGHGPGKHCAYEFIVLIPTEEGMPPTPAWLALDRTGKVLGISAEKDKACPFQFDEET
jgi:hypothetical protein